MQWPVQVVGATGSTNADLVAAVRRGEGGPRVLAARRQDAGRGRLDRGWSSPDGASVAVSWLWRPARPQRDRTWLPMVVGLGVVDAVRALGLRSVALKWPNDVVVPAGPRSDGEQGATTGLRKLAGVLVEVATAPDGTAHVVAGVGLNVGQQSDDLPVPSATSLLLATGRDPGFDAALDALVVHVGRRLDDWGSGAARDAALREDYRTACTTPGRVVHVRTPGGSVDGTAEDVDDDGCLVVVTDDGTRHRLSAGDVEHVR
ncbi:biotin--[acetyl-CoA-carboxylase] ligase [Aquipuribacter nitratireducens]|uniref:biotin--[biotin carboxyl-carrier protein] ligase n=1 Tax=Aquipuribacter nitratireducens TaxID=650104 RepID=A0ABW0GM58_9MICO